VATATSRYDINDFTEIEHFIRELYESLDVTQSAVGPSMGVAVFGILAREFFSVVLQARFSEKFAPQGVLISRKGAHFLATPPEGLPGWEPVVPELQGYRFRVDTRRFLTVHQYCRHTMEMHSRDERINSLASAKFIPIASSGSIETHEEVFIWPCTR
jgi:hypothetical protein